MSMSARNLTIALSVIFLIGSMVGLVVTLPQVQSTTPSTELTVMTYNLYQGYTPDGYTNLDAILAAIQEADPDLLGLEESDSGRISSMNVDTVMWLASRLGMYSCFGPPSSKQIVGVAFLSKYPIVNATYYELTSKELPRVLVHAVVSIGTTELNVFVVHLGLTYADRTTQAAEVIDIIDSVPAPKILMGDFNTQPTGTPDPGVESPDDTIHDDLSDYLNDTWTAAGHSLDSPEGYTWPSITPVERIDYIWVSPDIAVTSCTVITDALGSDHLPVVADVTLP